MFLVFFDPGKDGAVPQPGCDLFLQGFGVHPGKFEEVLVKRAIKGVFAVFFRQSSAAFIEHAGKDHIAPQPNSGTAGWMGG